MNTAGRQLLVDSRDEATRLNHSTINTGHLLLALIQSGDSVAASALEELGMSLNLIREQVAAYFGSDNDPLDGDMQFTSQACRVLDLSLMEAKKLNSSSVGPEHVLLGLVRLCESDYGLHVNRILKIFRVSTDDVRRKVVTRMVVQANA